MQHLSASFHDRNHSSDLQLHIISPGCAAFAQHLFWAGDAQNIGMWLYLDFKGQWMCSLGSMAVFSFIVPHRFLSRQVNVPTVNPGAPPTVKRGQKVGLQLAVIYTVTVFS